MKMMLFLLVILFLSNCSKKELKGDISGLCGKWKAKRTCFYWGSESDIYLSDSTSFVNSPVELEIKQRGELVFTSPEGTEKFKIIDYSITQKNGKIYSKPYNGTINEVKQQLLSLTVVDHKRQKFYFNYRFTIDNDVNIIGDYWRIDQAFYSTQTPNFTYDLNPFVSAGTEVSAFALEAQFQRIN